MVYTFPGQNIFWCELLHNFGTGGNRGLSYMSAPVLKKEKQLVLSIRLETTINSLVHVKWWSFIFCKDKFIIQNRSWKCNCKVQVVW